MTTEVGESIEDTARMAASIVYSYVRGQDRALVGLEDLFNEGLRVLMEKPEANFTAAKWAMIDLVRHRTKYKSRKNFICVSMETPIDEDFTVEDTIADENLVPVQNLMTKSEDLSTLAQALNSLPPEHREILVMYVFNNMSIDDIAKLKDTNFDTTYHSYRKALKELTKQYTQCSKI